MISSGNRLFSPCFLWMTGALVLFTFAIQPSWNYLVRVYFHNPLESHSIWVMLLAFFIFLRESKEIDFRFKDYGNIGLCSAVLFLSLYIASVIADINLLGAILSIGLLGAIIHTLLGWNNLKRILFPLFILVLSFPITTAIDLALGYEVRLMASQISFQLLKFMGIARDLVGVNIVLENSILTVDSSCSGLKTLSVLLIMNLILGYLFFKEIVWKRVVLIIAAIIIAGVANSLRITTIAVIANQYGLNHATGILHTYSGMMVFALSLILFWPVYVYLEKK